MGQAAARRPLLLTKSIASAPAFAKRVFAGLGLEGLDVVHIDFGDLTTDIATKLINRLA